MVEEWRIIFNVKELLNYKIELIKKPIFFSFEGKFSRTFD